jgi:L-fuculose-phosphate aldolase
MADGRVLVTPAGEAKGMLAPDDLVVLELDGSPVDPASRASSEIAVHLHIYRERSDVMAVVHAHPPAATAFATAGLPLMDQVLPEILSVTGPVPIVPYARSGTTELARAFDPYLADHDVFLMANHGATAVGASPAEAHRRMESLEHAARILINAHLLGGAVTLPDGEGDALTTLWRQRRHRQQQRGVHS